jgi:hypothetical protein
MKPSLKNNDLFYIPNLEKGECLFDGMPCPTEHAFEYLGQEGVKYKHQRLSEMLDWRKIMYGEKEETNYGFYPIQKFISIKNRIQFLVGNTIQEKYDYLEMMEDVPLVNPKIPELMVSDGFKLNNHEKLKEKNHYLIDTYPLLDTIPKNSTIIDFYRFDK